MVASKGCAARDTSGKLSPWSFERRPVGDDDILIEIKFCGICHSDIHQLRGDWGPQKYPQVPGHEIAGVVVATGKNVTRFKVGDHTGVGCMVDSCGTCDSCRHGEEQHCDNDIRRFGAKEVVVVDSVEKLKPYNKALDYMISTIPVNYDVAAYASSVKPYGNYTQVGMPAKGEVTVNNFAFNRNRVRYSTSLIGGIPQTQEVIDYCAKNKIYPEVQVIKASEVNETWEKVINKEARYHYVIETATI